VAAVGVNTAPIAAAIAAATEHCVNNLTGGVRINRTPPFLFQRIMKELPIQIEGCVKVVLPGTMFRVELDNKHLVLATICGKMRKRFVRLTVGDRVKMEMSPYDLDKARITWRLR
jgi:translation initiation factor IF-1